MSLITAPPAVAIQTQSLITGAVATGTTIIPLDNTIPQITEGDEYMSLSITPKNINNKLMIMAVVNYSVDQASPAIIALFQNGLNDALCVSSFDSLAQSFMQQSLNYSMVAGTINPITFSIRCGGSVASTMTFNGRAALPYFGGKFASSIIIYEFSK